MKYKRVDLKTIPQKSSQGVETWWWFFEGLTLLDIDGDSDKDLYVGMTGAIWDSPSESDPMPYLVRNDLSSYEFNGVVIQKNQVAGWINNIVVGDYNQDGIDDGVLVDQGREDKLYQGKSFDELDFGVLNTILSSGSGPSLIEGNFEAPSDPYAWSVMGRDFWHGGVNSRDFDLDGNLDIVVTALGRAGVELWYGDGTGRFNLAPQGALPGFIDRTEPKASGDWISIGITGFIDSGNDGVADIFVLPYSLTDGNSNGYIALNQAGSSKSSYLDLGDLAVAERIDGNSKWGYSEALVADFDKNGLEDIVALVEASDGQSNGEAFLLYLSQVSPHKFLDETIMRFGSYSSLYQGVKERDQFPGSYVNGASTELYMGDYNADGYLDLNLGFPFLGTWDELENTVFLNDGRGHFSRSFSIEGNISRFQSSAQESLRSDGLSDINDDGIGDFFIVEEHWKGSMPNYTISLLISESETFGPRFLFDTTDQIDGSHGNDVFISTGGGSDEVNGSSGIDTVSYSFPKETIAVTTSDGIIKVSKPMFAAEDNLSNIERVKFSDRSIAFDLDGHAGSALRVLATVFGKSTINNPSLVGIALSIFDQGATLEEVSALALSYALGEAPSTRNIVSLLWKNLIGTEIDPLNLSSFSALIDSGEMSASGLTAFVSSLDLTGNLIDITGLATSGVEYL